MANCKHSLTNIQIPILSGRVLSQNWGTNVGFRLLPPFIALITSSNSLVLDNPLITQTAVLTGSRARAREWINNWLATIRYCTIIYYSGKF